MARPAQSRMMRLTDQQEHLLVLLSQGVAPEKAVRDAGYKARNYRDIVSKTQQRARMVIARLQQHGFTVQAKPLTFIQSLESVGITNDRLAQKYNELVDAEKSVFFKDDLVAEVPDYDVQLKALDQINKIRGAYNADESSRTELHVNLSLIAQRGQDPIEIDEQLSLLQAESVVDSGQERATDKAGPAVEGAEKT